jgi:hypothetical protein
MNVKQLICSVAVMTLLVGCAAHPEIKANPIERVSSQEWNGKNFKYEVFYSQPKPGIISGGEQLDLVPLSKAELSVASAQVLSNFPKLINQVLPSNVTLIKDGISDYDLTVNLIANHKKGPTYADFEFGKSLAKGLFTLGLASDEYNIIADFSVEYILKNKSGESFTKKYAVNESIDNQKGAFEIHDRNADFASELLQKHMITTAATFFNEAKSKL